MQSTFHSEPTEPDHPNPYYSNPYNQIPPPPPSKSSKGHWITILIIISLASMLGGIVIGILYTPAHAKSSTLSIPSPTPTPTAEPTQSPSIPPLPTAPPTPTAPPIPSSAPYSSDQIYDDLVQAGLADNGGGHDFSPFDFRGSTIRPEGGMIDFQDLSTRSNMNIATFASTLEVPYYIDDYTGAFSVVASVHNCVLQVQNAANRLSPNLISKYKSVLETYCT